MHALVRAAVRVPACARALRSRLRPPACARGVGGRRACVRAGVSSVCVCVCARARVCAHGLRLRRARLAAHYALTVSV